MKQELTAELVYETDTQRFYKLSQPITVGKTGFGKTVDIPAALAVDKKSIRPEYEYLYPTECTIICISRATSHDECLVFVGMETILNHPYGRTNIIIGGSYTMLIHGGDKQSIKADHVYIRTLATINGYSYHPFKPVAS